jgi:hypothetical protein
VLDGAWVVRTGRFKNLVEVVSGRLGVLHEVVFGSRHELLTEVIDFLLDVAVSGHCSQAMRSTFLPLFPILGTLSFAFDGDLDGRDPTTADSHSFVDQSEGGLDILLARSVPGRDVEQLIGSFWLLAAEVVNQRVACHAIPEG